MGANESTPSNFVNDSTFIPVADYDNYDILKHSENSAYGQFIIARDRQSTKKFALIEMVCSNEQELQTLMKSAKEKQAYACESLIKVYSAHKQTSSEYCGQFQRLLVKIEYITRSLQHLIASRQKSKSIFSEKEIISMIESTVIALNYLQMKGIIHGQINPACILVDRQNSNSLVFKLTDGDLLYKTVLTDYQSFYHGTISENQGCYLSPKLLYALSHRMINPSHDAEKTNVFAVGLCALEMAIQCSKDCEINDIFDLSEFEIIPRRLKDHLEKVSGSYSESLRMLIGRMVRLDENRRVDYQNILQEIENYKQGIVVFCNSRDDKMENSQETSSVDAKSEKGIDLEESSRFVQDIESKKLQSEQQVNSQLSQKPKEHCSLLTLSGNVLDSQEIIPQSSKQYFDLQAVASPACFQMDSTLLFSEDHFSKNQETRESNSILTSSVSSKGGSLFTMPKRRSSVSKYSPIRIIYAAMKPVENQAQQGFKEIGNHKRQIGKQMTQYQQENDFKGTWQNSKLIKGDETQDEQKYLSPLRQQNNNMIKNNNSQPNPNKKSNIDIGQLSKSSVKIDLGKNLLESKNEQRNASITERTKYQDGTLIKKQIQTNIVSPSVVLQNIQLQHPQHHFF